MKILFTSLNSKFIHSNLAIKYLSKCMTGEVDAVEYTINEDIEEIFYDILSKGYDMVAFSCYIWNIEKTLKIAQNIKKASPKTLVILGGPEVSYKVREFMLREDQIDMVVAGEGEQAFFDLDKIIQGDLAGDHGDPERAVSFIHRNKEDLLKIPNLFFRDAGAVCNEASAEELQKSMETKDLSIVPRAYENEQSESIENKIVYYETSRGCTFNCSYCLSATSKGIRYFDEERVYEELKLLVSLGAKQIKFVDRTFNADSKRATRLVEYLMTLDDGKINFHFEITAYLLQSELLDIIRTARIGLFQFEIGVQTTNAKTLLAIHRGNQFEKLKENVNTIQSFGNIHQHLDLIAGLPYEDLERFVRSFNDVFDLQPQALQLGFLKLLKGSPIYEQIERYGYVFRSYPPYEVISNQFITSQELIELKRVENVLDRYYNKGRYANSMSYLYPFFKNNGYRLFKWLSEIIEQDRIDLTKKNDEFYALFLLSKRIGATVLSYDHEFLVELLRLDYLMMGRNPNVPDFLKARMIADKAEVFDILKEEEVLRELSFDQHITPKEAFKKIQWSNFNFDVLQYKREQKMMKNHNVVIINYDYKRKGDESFAAIRRSYDAELG
ncbi:MAG: radical SAM protein [Peptostreptococcaceae bacterium]|nr:radical SAM protein [Peptostreptococcaceae bacterium]